MSLKNIKMMSVNIKILIKHFYRAFVCMYVCMFVCVCAHSLPLKRLFFNCKDFFDVGDILEITWL